MICMAMCVCVCARVDVHVRIVCAHCMCECMCVLMCVRMGACGNEGVCERVRVCVLCVRARARVCMRMCECACARLCLHVCASYLRILNLEVGSYRADRASAVRCV